MKSKLDHYQFALGMALISIRDVGTGAKPIATGEIRRGERKALTGLLKRSGFARTVRLSFRRADGAGNIGYCCWRFPWAAKALEWIDQCQVDSNGDYHRHWIQGLLYGYSPEAIDEFLSRLSGRTSKSGVSTPRSQRDPGGARAEPKEGA